MIERAESGQKLYTRMRLWEFPDQYVVEPTDGSSGSPLAITRADGSMKLIDGVPECSSLRVPKIKTLFGVIGMLKLVADVVSEQPKGLLKMDGMPLLAITSITSLMSFPLALALVLMGFFFALTSLRQVPNGIRYLFFSIMWASLTVLLLQHL